MKFLQPMSYEMIRMLRLKDGDSSNLVTLDHYSCILKNKYENFNCVISFHLHC
jgi:hypothetical protein